MKNYNKFDEITHTPLRVFNRVVLMSNLLADFGEEAAVGYAQSFTDDERKQLFIMHQFIKEKGPEKARKFVTKDLKLVPEKELEDV